MATDESTESMHWTEGPARWAAAIVLGIACLGGLGWSILGRPVIVGREGSPAAARLEQTGQTGAADAAEADDELEIIDVVEDETFAQRINLNTAGSAELQLLPGIGPALSARIIEDREANGPYKSVDDLMRVKGIGPRTVARLRNMARAE